jgi:hypothetical protein
MEWINRRDQEPNPKLVKILVWGERCNCPHVAFYDYQGWCHTEDCQESGYHCSGGDIDFKFWQLAPDPPIDLD